MPAVIDSTTSGSMSIFQLHIPATDSLEFGPGGSESRLFATGANHEKDVQYLRDGYFGDGLFIRGADRPSGSAANWADESESWRTWRRRDQREGSRGGRVGDCRNLRPSDQLYQDRRDRRPRALPDAGAARC